MPNITAFVSTRCARRAQQRNQTWSVPSDGREEIVREVQSDPQFAFMCANRTYILRLINQWEARNWGKSRAALR